MFDINSIGLSAALAGLAVGALPLLWICAAQGFQRDDDDSWRDTPPFLLSLVRPLLRILAPLVDANLDAKRPHEDH